MPSVYEDDGTLSAFRSCVSKMYDYLGKYSDIDSIKFFKMHTGETVTICDTEIHMLYTHEELTDAKTAQTLIAGDFNNSCVTFRLSFDGASILITGDINVPAMRAMMTNQLTELKNYDAVQTSHHFYNDLRSLYGVLKAKHVFVPAPLIATTNNTARKEMLALLKEYAGENVYVSSLATQGFEFKNGTFVEVFSKPDLGTVYTGWDW